MKLNKNLWGRQRDQQDNKHKWLSNSLNPSKTSQIQNNNLKLKTLNNHPEGIMYLILGKCLAVSISLLMKPSTTLTKTQILKFYMFHPMTIQLKQSLMKDWEWTNCCLGNWAQIELTGLKTQWRNPHQDQHCKTSTVIGTTALATKGTTCRREKPPREIITRHTPIIRRNGKMSHFKE